MDPSGVSQVIKRVRNVATDPAAVARGVKNPRRTAQFVSSMFLTLRKSQLDYQAEAEDRKRVLSTLFDVSEETVRGYENELESGSAVLDRYASRYDELAEAGEVSQSPRAETFGTSSSIDCTTLYVVTRILEPSVAVQTGVQFGAFDAHIVAAMAENETGTLHSIDLPGSPSDDYDYGYLVPRTVRDRWELHLGDAREVLPDLLSELQPIDMFVHDSLHTEEHMRWEYETARPYVRTGGVISSHDVLKSDVFQSFSEQYGLEYAQIANTGVARLTSPR